MESVAPPVLIPVEARYTMTDRVVDIGIAATNDSVLPQWARGWTPAVLPVVACLQLLRFTDVARGQPWFVSIVTAAVIGLFGWLWWRSHKKRMAARAAIVGKEIHLRFFEDGFDFGPTASGPRIGYAAVDRVARDDRGLVLLGLSMHLFVPTSAFASPNLRDAVYEMVGAHLKK